MRVNQPARIFIFFMDQVVCALDSAENIFICCRMGRRLKARLADVARAAGVSSATASRALSQPDLVAEGTLARIVESARALGYRPDAAARTLASGRSMTVAAVMPTLDNAIFSRALHAMQAVFAAEGYQLLIASHDYNPAAEAETIRMLLGRGIDGLILVGAARTAEADILIRDAMTPVVFTWRAQPGQAGVTVDNARAGWLAARHLIDLGHRRIGVVTGRTLYNDRQKARLDGARDCLAEAGIGLPDWLASEQPTTLAGGRSGCAALLALAEPPTAIIGGIDHIAIGCVVEAQARGMAVPGDLSVVGIDDIDMSAHLSPPLTTVHIPTARIGAEAAAMLLAAIRERTRPAAVELPIELVIRRSTGRVAGG
jgi:LacI family transcriptional regulator